MDLHKKWISGLYSAKIPQFPSEQSSLVSKKAFPTEATNNLSFQDKGNTKKKKQVFLKQSMCLLGEQKMKNSFQVSAETRPNPKTKPGTLETGAHNSSFSPQSVCVGSSRFWQPQDMCGPLLVTQSATSVVQLPPPPLTSMPTHTHGTRTHQSRLSVVCV